MADTAYKLRGKIAGLSRSRVPDDPELVDTKRKLKELMLSEHVAKIVQSWPPLTTEQLDRVAVLLRSGGEVA